ncbi:MAG: alanyl-tRNA editing protein [Proteobacteria bacterium]|nr:alanyl-tRNA editing protein [Pseudomonadota bacterium]
MTEILFRDDSYLRECQATVTDSGDGAVLLERTIFYPTGGGQPGDTGRMSWDGGNATIINTVYGDGGEIRHLVAEGDSLPGSGTSVNIEIDWDRRYRHMRMHTALHLLGSVLQYGVTGGSIGAEKSRLDFDMVDPVDKEAVNSALQALVADDHPITCRWITDEELAAKPELVRTLSVQPPKGAGKIRLLEIEGVDLQPCGGTHLKSTAEVGAVRLGKVEKKGKHNRRVSIVLDD